MQEGPARSSSRVIKRLVTCEGVRLHDADVIDEMLLRMLTDAGPRIFEEGRGRIFSAERLVITDISPEPASDRLQFRKHRYGRVVGVDALRSQYMRADRLREEFKRRIKT